MIPSILLLSDDTGRLVAVDPTTCAVRWTAAQQICGGLSALPAVVICQSSGTLSALRLSDGQLVGSLHVPGLRSNIATDSATGVIFGDVPAAYGRHALGRFSWTSGGRVAEDVGPAAGETFDGAPIFTVVQPAPGKRISHLVVCSEHMSDLRVLALPDFALVHTHTLGKMRVRALAADPWGGALAVIDDHLQAIRILVWPLPGMPVLG